MELVVDATVLFAAIIGRDKAHELFFKDELRLVALPYLIEEFNKNIGTLAKICGTPKLKLKRYLKSLRKE